MASRRISSAVVVPLVHHSYRKPPPHPRLELLGRTFDRWTVIRFARMKKGHSLWLCRCACGTTREVKGSRLLLGTTRSCGCLRRELTANRMTTHGDYHKRKPSPELAAWSSMLSRCFNKNHRRYMDYGGRGITVDPLWLGPEGFANFLEYMGRKPDPKLTLERMDNDKGCGPDNCCWATRAWQVRNRRPQRPRIKRQQARAAKRVTNKEQRNDQP